MQAFGMSVGSLHDPENAFAKAFDQAQAAVEDRFFHPYWRLYWFLFPKEWRLRCVKGSHHTD
jgi:hypothetical protein